MSLLVDQLLRHACVKVGMRFELEEEVQNVHQEQNLLMVSGKEVRIEGEHILRWYHG